MSSHLIFPHVVDAGNLVSATSQGGRKSTGLLTAAATNLGRMTVQLTDPSVVLTTVPKIEIVDGGDIKTATFKFYPSGSGDAYGRMADTYWQADSGIRFAAADLDSQPSNVCACDTDGDGIAETVFVAAGTKIYRKPAGSYPGWTYVADIPALANRTEIAVASLCSQGGKLWATTGEKYTSGDLLYMCVKCSVDFGVTWTETKAFYLGNATDGAPYNTNHRRGTGNIIALASGKLLVCYFCYLSGHVKSACSTSVDGITWSMSVADPGYPVNVDATATEISYPWAMQDQSGVTHVFSVKSSDSLIYERISSATDPGVDGAWGAGTDTLWTPTTSMSYPRCCVALDGTKYVSFLHATGAKIQFSKLKGAGTYSAAATILDAANALAYPNISTAHGALYCPYQDTVALDALCHNSKYWIISTDPNYTPSWTSAEPQDMKDIVSGTGVGAWITFGGAAAVAGDYYSVVVTYDYGAERMFLGTPRRPSRSITGWDSGLVVYADWAAVFDAGANNLFVADTILAKANVEHLHVQFHTANSWGAPSVDTALSFVQQTIAAAARTLAGCEITLTSGTLTPHALKGRRVRFATSGTVWVVDDNSATKIWCQGDTISSETGDVQILSPYAWATQTLGAYRYMRVLVQAQQTAETYYQIDSLIVGIRTALAAHHKAGRLRVSLPGSDQRLQGGGTLRQVFGPGARGWSVTWTKISTAEHAEMLGRLLYQGAAPVALVPDSSVATEWALVHPALASDWGPVNSMIDLEEVV